MEVCRKGRRAERRKERDVGGRENDRKRARRGDR